jgi:hypothetical protein
MKVNLQFQHSLGDMNAFDVMAIKRRNCLSIIRTFMKLHLLTTIAFVGLIACDSPEEPKVEKVNSNEISVGPVIQDSLSKEQLEKIGQIQKTFAEVYPASLEETITNFKRDQNPDREIEIWLQMATAYKMFKEKHAKLDSAAKNEAFELLLLRSMMPDEEAIKEAKVQVLNDAQISELLHYYNSQPSPIRVSEK